MRGISILGYDCCQFCLKYSFYICCSPSKIAEPAQGLDYYDEEDADSDEEDDEYSEDDYDAPEDDPDVKDIRWF